MVSGVGRGVMMALLRFLQMKTSGKCLKLGSQDVRSTSLEGGGEVAKDE
jgi:hypothetical protein